MATAAEYLRSFSAYPIPSRTIEVIAGGRGIALDEIITPDKLATNSYKGAKAEVFSWLAEAPNVSQGGQTYSFSEDQRKHFRNLAAVIFAEIGETSEFSRYGYKGDTL